MSFDWTDFIVRASTIDELLSDDFELIPGGKEDSALAARRLSAWCRASADGDWTVFALRLAKDGLSIDRVLQAFSNVRRRAGTTPPQWFTDAQWILGHLQQTPDAAHSVAYMHETAPLPFQELFSCLRIEAERLAERGVTDAVSDNARQIIALSSKRLVSQLTQLCAEVFFSTFSEWRSGTQSAQETGPDGPLGYEDFTLHMRSEGIARLLASKPVLLRLVSSLTRQWIEKTTELAARFDTDAKKLHSILGVAATNASIASIEDGLSDPHNFGRTVVTIVFNDGSRVVYKPKDMQIDRIWTELCKWIEDSGAPISLRTARTVVGEGYGWCEYIKHSDCENPSDAALFYRRSGAWLALFHIFGGSDMHGENIIAAGSHPVPIDLEMLLQPSEDGFSAIPPERSAPHVAAQLLSQSVIAIGLLPAYARTPEKGLLNLGGLDQSRMEISDIVWRAVGTLDMQPQRRTFTTLSDTNLPKTSGIPVALGDHIDCFIAGFNDLMGYLIDHRSEILSSTMVGNLRSVTVRKVLRPTRFYYLLLKRLKNHQNMDDGPVWSAELDFPSRLVDLDQPDNSAWLLLQAERKAMSDLNVPLFKTHGDELCISDYNGAVASLSGLSGFQAFRHRLSGLDHAASDWQSELIKSSLEPLSGVQQHHTESLAPSDGEGFVTHPRLPATELWSVASGIATLIEKSAIRSGNSASWIGLNWIQGTRAAQIEVIGSDLYDGALGIAIFLAACARHGGHDSAGGLAIAGVAPLRSLLTSSNPSRFSRRMGLGGTTGMGSIIYGLTLLHNFMPDQGLLDDAFVAARLITDEMIVSDRHLDVTSGTAGGAISLLKLHEVTGDKDALAKAVRCGEHLLRSRSVDSFRMWCGLPNASQPLTGLSHGAAGFGYAFARLYAATGREDFLDAARDCIFYENSCYSKQHENWPDYRKTTDGRRFWPCQWCHGAGGIGLARIASASLTLPGIHDQIEADAARAANTVAKAWPYTLDTLCCGNAGNIEFLNCMSRHSSDSHWRELAEDRLSNMIHRSSTRGDFQWEAGSKHFNLGMFRGSSGIGYAILRHIDASLPNILVWE